MALFFIDYNEKLCYHFSIIGINEDNEACYFDRNDYGELGMDNRNIINKFQIISNPHKN